MFEHIGIKSGTAIAGFFGGVAALSYLKPSSLWQAVSVLACGVGGAIYWTPVTVHYLGLSGDLEYGAAFTLGLISMAMVGAIMSLIDAIKADPWALIDRLRGGGK